MTILAIISFAALLFAGYGVYQHQKSKNQQKQTTRNYRDLNQLN